jgi:hypothetical protein
MKDTKGRLGFGIHPNKDRFQNDMSIDRTATGQRTT